MRKILFPIYFKLVVFILIILGLSLSAYVYYATTLFQNDKVSYVYEGVDDYNFNQYLGLENKISYYKKILELMMLSGNSFDNSWSVLKKNNNIFAFFNLSKHKVSSVVSLLKRSQLDALYTQNFQTIPKSGFIISGEHIYFMGMSNKKNSGIMLNLESVLSRSESSLYESSYIINKQPSTNAQKKLIGKIFKE
ncbi:MAG: hypothetical protein HON90_09030, partial [Halobacteriovoraceae bacterium]|nr:hypothetical protein [Halobacteriovoraceae bacterium]